MVNMELWIIAISCAVVALSFLSAGIALYSAYRGIRRLSAKLELLIDESTTLIQDIDRKVERLEPCIHLLSLTGEVLGRKFASCTCKKQEAAEEEENKTPLAQSLIRWALEGVCLWQKAKERTK